MKIGDMAKRTGLTGYTIRYYERIGLLPKIGRHIGPTMLKFCRGLRFWSG